MFGLGAIHTENLIKLLKGLIIIVRLPKKLIGTVREKVSCPMIQNSDPDGA